MLKTIYNKLKNIEDTFEAKLEVKLTSHMTYVYKDIDGLKTLRIWVGKYIKHILNKGAKYTKKYCKKGAKWVKYWVVQPTHGYSQKVSNGRFKTKKEAYESMRNSA